MKFLVFLSVLGIVFLASCGKGLTTKPQISIESITTLVPLGGDFNATLKFSDKQGDLGGATFTAVVISKNILPPPNGMTVDATIQDSIPDFPNYQTGEFLFTLSNNKVHQETLRNDSLIMKFVVTDRAGNVSDTVTSPTIVALYQ
ncbi:MAG TPA: hypothetical protein VKR53_08900 [Puia sp.]|nr:hypothetical protein [Puia sp.]